jgi:sigma-70, region 4
VESVHQILNLNSKKEYDIVHKMFIEEMTDVEIADIYKISRQYINCIRRKYKKKLKEKLFE